MAACHLMFPFELRVHGVKSSYLWAVKSSYPFGRKVLIPLPAQSPHTFTHPVSFSIRMGRHTIASDANPHGVQSVTVSEPSALPNKNA